MKTLTLLIMLLSIHPLFSQTDSSVTFGLPEMRIKQVEKGKIVTYDFDNSLNKFILTPSMLLPDTNKYKYKVKLADVKQVQFRTGSNFWNVAGIVGSVGFVLGFFAWGYFDFNDRPDFHINQAVMGGFVTAIPFALIGGIFGALSSNYEDYEFPGMNDKQKYSALLKVFKKYQQKR